MALISIKTFNKGTLAAQLVCPRPPFCLSACTSTSFGVIQVDNLDLLSRWCCSTRVPRQQQHRSLRFDEGDSGASPPCGYSCKPPGSFLRGPLNHDDASGLAIGLAHDDVRVHDRHLECASRSRCSCRCSRLWYGECVTSVTRNSPSPGSRDPSHLRLGGSPIAICALSRGGVHHFREGAC